MRARHSSGRAATVLVRVRVQGQVVRVLEVGSHTP